MKILAVVTYYAPHWTGLTTHAVRLAEDLVARGHEVTVLTTRHAPELARQERRNCVRIVRLKPVARFSRGMIAPAFPFAAARLVAWADIVQIHSPLPEAWLVALLGRQLGRPVVFTHHADIVMPGGLANRLLERAALALLRSAARLSTVATSYNQDYADSSPVLKPVFDRLAFIPPPVRFPAPDLGRVVRWRAEIAPSGGILIGFAGRWVEEKGFDILLRALPILLRAVPDAHLVYAGEPNVVYEHFFERCRPLLAPVREHVTLLGLIRDRCRMADFYGLCDLFVLPSRSDMLALVQIEAMLCGTPVVASDIPGSRVVVRETGFGRLAPPDDPEGLARVLAETIRDRHLYLPRREEVLRAFDPDRSIDAYEDLFRQVLGRAH